MHLIKKLLKPFKIARLIPTHLVMRRLSKKLGEPALRGIDGDLERVRDRTDGVLEAERDEVRDVRLPDLLE